MFGVPIGRNSFDKVPRGAARWMLVALALANASCVPATVSTPPSIAAFMPVPEAEAAAIPVVPASHDPAQAPVPTAVATMSFPAFRGRTPLDELRSLDCLAQAIYYEAASESEAGQRAVAQVVLNRVRHPAWPNSVCGVVYQGPMRAGGGCQFTFTCDGSLARPAGGIAWARARAIAAEALAGRSGASVGLATHYHTFAVAPAWAPRLVNLGSIGAHIFYRLPGTTGTRPAFAAAYSGIEPLPRPTMSLVRRNPVSLSIDPAWRATEVAGAPRLTVPSDIAPDPRWVASNLPESTIREEYRNSGQWRDDAPAAIAGH